MKSEKQTMKRFILIGMAVCCFILGKVLPPPAGMTGNGMPVAATK